MICTKEHYECRPSDYNPDGPRDRYVSTEDMLMTYFDQVTKDEFGWGLKEKLRKIDPEHRYGPLIKKIMDSYEWKHWEIFWEHKIEKDPRFIKVRKEVEWFGRDLFDDRSWRERVKQIRERPTEEQKATLPRFEADKLDKEGFHVDNDDIKDLFEDGEYVAGEVRRFLDLKNPLIKQVLEIDAELRYSKEFQALTKMVFNDFGIKSY